MPYDVASQRYAHLAGLTEEEIELVMIIADVAISRAKQEFEKSNEYSNAAAEAGSARADHSGDVVRDRVGGRPDAAAVGQDFNKVR